MSPVQRDQILLHARWLRRKTAPPTVVDEVRYPRLSPGANAVLNHAAEHNLITTQKAGELLERADQLVRARRGPARLSLTEARDVCMRLTDDGLLTFGTGPDTWIPTRNLTEGATQ